MPKGPSVEIGRVEATLREAKTPFGLTVDLVEIQAEGVKAALKPFDLALQGPGKFRVVVGEASVAAFLNKKSPASLRDFQVEIEGGVLRVQATAAILVSIRVAAICELEIENGRQLFVRLKSVEKFGSAVQNMIEKQLEQINPLLDLKDLPFSGELESVEVDKGRITLTGAISGLKP